MASLGHPVGEEVGGCALEFEQFEEEEGGLFVKGQALCEKTTRLTQTIQEGAIPGETDCTADGGLQFGELKSFQP